VVTFPAGTTPQPELLAELNAIPSRHLLSDCTTDEPCPLLFADLNRDGVAEAILFAPLETAAATREGDSWRRLDRLEQVASVSHNDRAAVIEALKQGNFRVGDPPWQAVEINGELYQVADPPKPDEPCDDESRAVSGDPAPNPEGP
jgi:hypothetical protein